MKKFIYLINVFILTICAFMITGCGENYENFILHFSNESIELELGEENDYMIKIENYKKTDIDFTFYFEKEIAQISEEVKDYKDGRFGIKVKGLMSGTTTLNITLNQNKTSINIPVRITDPIEAFELKSDQNLYVVRGDSLKLPIDLFNFFPATTLQTSLNYIVNGEPLVGDTFFATDDMPNDITIVATSAYNSNLTVSFDVKVVDKINVYELTGTTLYDMVSEEEIPTYKDDKDYTIDIVTNSVDGYIKTLKFVYNPLDEYNYEFVSKSGGIHIETYSLDVFENTIFVELQQVSNSKLVNDSLLIRVSHKNFAKYYEEIEYKVAVKAIPTKVELNGRRDALSLDLYNGMTINDATIINLSISPIKSYYKNLSLSFFTINDLGERVETTYAEISKYICVMYGNYEITGEDQEITDLSKQLRIYGLVSLNDEIKNIVIKVNCFSSLTDDVVSNDILVALHNKATRFYIDDKYKQEGYANPIIYMNLGEEIDFDGINVKYIDKDSQEQNAYIGTITAYADYLCEGYVAISQKGYDSNILNIKALKPGTASYTLYITSGLYVRLTIIVKEELNIDNFYISIASISSDNIAELLYRKQGNMNTLDYMAIGGENFEFTLAYNIMPITVDDDMYKISIKSENEDIAVINKRTIKTVSTSDDDCQITITLTKKIIQDFKLVDDETDYNYDFTIRCFKPIEKFSFEGYNVGVADGTMSNRITVYENKDGRTVDEVLSKVNFVIKVDGKNYTYKDLLLTFKGIKVDWIFSISAEKRMDGNYSLNYAGINYGVFNPIDLTYICTADESAIPFSISCKLTYHGKEYTGVIRFTLQEYKYVEKIWLLNYQSYIYLDETISEITLYPNIYPQTATNKNFTAQFIPNPGTSLSCVNVTYTKTAITISYSGVGGGSGVLSIKPIATNSDNVSSNISIYVGNGTKDAPLHISTFEQFQNIEFDRADKYYVIDTMIDAAGYKMERPFPAVSCKIYGMENSKKAETIAGIKNLKIENYRTNADGYSCYGLFAEITKDGELKNLDFSGCINVNNNSSIKNAVGLVCGVNKGLISNVKATLEQSAVSLNGSTENKVGGLCGLNSGIIENIYTEETRTTLFVNMVEKFTLTLSNGNEKYKFGGICGENFGEISFNKENRLIYRYNNFGTSVVAYMQVNLPSGNLLTGYVGGVVGYADSGDIIGLLATGNINREIASSNYSKYVGGIAGYMRSGNISYNISRVFIRGSLYVGGLIGFAEAGDVKYNKVQAIDDGTKIDIDASLIVSSSNISPIFNSNTTSVQTKVNSVETNSAVTYFTRDFINEKKNYSLTTQYYYGDYVKDIGSYNSNVFDPDPNMEYRTLKNLYGPSEYDTNGGYSYSITLMYHEAKDYNNQSLLDQVNTISLNKLNLFTDVIDLTAVSSNSAILNVASDGNLVLMKTGTVKLRLISSYNYLDYLELTIYVINYVNGFELYETSDFSGMKTKNNDIRQLMNNDSAYLYVKYVSQVQVGNTLIDLVDCDYCNLKIDIDDEDFIVANKNGAMITLKGVGTTIPADAIKVSFRLMHEADNGVVRYLKYITELDRWMFVCEKENSDLDINFNYSLGIYEINTNRSSNEYHPICVEPMDIVSITVEYKTYNEEDVLYLDIMDMTRSTYIYNENISNFFDVKISEVVKNGEIYTVNYTISMLTSNINIGEYKLIFRNKNSSTIKTLFLKYSAQSITTVSIYNYTESDNSNIIVSEADNNIVYNTSYAMQQSNTVTAGKVNILKLDIEPEYADYSYIEITNSSYNIQNNSIALFSLLGEIYNGEEDTYTSLISSASYYTQNGIRIYKNSIINGSVSILYRLSTNVIEGDYISFNIGIYNENRELVYPQMEKQLQIAMEKEISVWIKGYDPSEKYIARGYSYVLDVKYTGFVADDIVIESNSPYLTVDKQDDVYVLNVSSEVDYPDDGSEGLLAQISYYGKRKVNGKEVRSSAGKIELTIVECVIRGLTIDNAFVSSEINSTVKQVFDLRDEILDQLKIDYLADAKTAVDALKNSLKNSAHYFYRSSDLFIEIFGDGCTNSDGEDIPKTVITDNQYIGINGYEITPKKVGNGNIHFGIYATMKYRKGFLLVSYDEDFKVDTLDQNLIKDFNLVVSQRTSEEHPLPINTYEELIAMREGNNYILMKDITLPTNFEPIKAAVASFDGNGYSLLLKGIYSYSGYERFGLFDTIEENTIVKNLTIEIRESNTVIFEFDNSASTAPFIMGLITGLNKGSITNCRVLLSNASSLLKISNTAIISQSSTSNIAALVGRNEGYITNSQVGIKIEANGANLAGFVAVNAGHISSSYVKKSSIKNTSTNVNNSTGGFCVTNTGKIIYSYIEGKAVGAQSLYCSDSLYNVQASSLVGGFIYYNDGSIADCYSNIPVISSSKNAGFVCINDGKIERVYSMSMLKNNDTENYPFVISYGSFASFNDCYYLKDELSSVNIDINSSNSNIDGIRETTLTEFATGYEVKTVENNENKKYDEFERQYLDFDKPLFTSFIKNSNNETNCGVWFSVYSNKLETFIGNYKLGKEKYITKLTYIEYITKAVIVSNNDYKYKNNSVDFVVNKLNLVSANMVAYSNKFISDSELNTETGEITFVYSNSYSYNADGSMQNPYIINTASKLESIKNLTINAVNGKYYRLVCDIDYEEEKIITSSLYKVIVAGYIEGNGLSVSGYSINTSENLAEAGLFGQIGDGYDYAVVQNITFIPKYLNFPNSKYVGSVAGTVNRANIYNVSVDGYKNNKQGTVVLGKNIVGGMFGRTTGDYDIVNISSSVSVNASSTCDEAVWTTQTAQSKILYKEFAASNDYASYAGSVIGLVGGNGVIRNVSITNNVACVGMICGLMFGGIGNNATVMNADIVIEDCAKTYIRASAYGGLFAGDISGNIKNVNISFSDEINDLEDKESYLKANPLFKTEPRIPLAIGGICGIARNNANIENCEENAEIIANKINVVGGIVGYIKQLASVSNCKYTATQLISKQTVGGIVGEYNGISANDISLIIKNCEVGVWTMENNVYVQKSQTLVKVYKPAQLKSDDIIYNTFVGGILGCISGYDSTNVSGTKNFKITNSRVYATLCNDSVIYGDSNETYDQVMSIGVIVGGYSTDEFENCSNYYITGENKAELAGNVYFVNIEIYTKNLSEMLTANKNNINQCISKQFLVRLSQSLFNYSVSSAPTWSVSVNGNVFDNIADNSAFQNATL